MNVPWKQAYAPNVGLVILTLFPQLINTAAYPLLAKPIAGDLHISPAEVLNYPLLNEAAFVFGILAGVTFIRHYNVRTVYLSMLATDIAVVLAVSFAPSDIVMSVVNVLAGLLGGIFLMVALPPLFTNFEPKYFPFSAALMVPCLFGASTLAPIVCGPLATASLWRPLFWGEALVLSLALILAVFTVAPKEAQQPDVPVDWFALVMGGFSMACVFAGIQQVASHDWPYLRALVPFLVGVAGFCVLVVVEYRKREALLPMERMLHGYAVIGFVGAAFGNAIYIADTQILTVANERIAQLQPMQVAATGWPPFAMTIVTGIIFALSLKTRWVPLYAFSGLAAITVGTGLLLAAMETHAAAAKWSLLVFAWLRRGRDDYSGLVHRWAQHRARYHRAWNRRRRSCAIDHGVHQRSPRRA